MSFIMSEFAFSISIKFSKSQLSVNYAVDIPSLGIFWDKVLRIVSLLTYNFLTILISIPWGHWEIVEKMVILKFWVQSQCEANDIKIPIWISDSGWINFPVSPKSTVAVPLKTSLNQFWKKVYYRERNYKF